MKGISDTKETQWTITLSPDLQQITRHLQVPFKIKDNDQVHTLESLDNK